MATTLSAFVIRTFAGRAGLFTATLLPLDGSATVDVNVSDLDGEPERFNERLVKTRLFRDAMTEAEPVIVVYQTASKESGNEVESVQRRTRHHLWIGQSADSRTGVVARIKLREQNAASQMSEASDVAEVILVDPTTSSSDTLLLALQRAERGVFRELLERLQSAEATGDPVTIGTITEGSAEAQPASWIVSVERASLVVEGGRSVDGFVESMTCEVARGLPFARVALTTAPRFIGAGGIVDPSYFEPLLVRGYVAQGSPMRSLLEQALNAGQRVRVLFGAERSLPEKEPGASPKVDRPVKAASAKALLDFDMMVVPDVGGTTVEPPASSRVLGLVLGVELLAPLASQARPVWVRVRREALDHPPEGVCGGPTPTSDLSPVNVASLQVPHRAAWEGVGCFNRGVYRIQVVSPVPVRIFVDGHALHCVLSVPFAEISDEASSTAGPAARPQEIRSLESVGGLRPKPVPGGKSPPLEVYLGHVCLENCHTVRVEVDEWRCGYRFELDVMKIR